MLLEAKLLFSYQTEREAEAVNKAVSPDNAKTPLGLDVRTSRHKRNLLTSVRCEKSIETFIAILDDLIACISVAEEAFRAANASDS